MLIKINGNTGRGIGLAICVERSWLFTKLVANYYLLLPIHCRRTHYHLNECDLILC